FAPAGLLGVRSWLAVPRLLTADRHNVLGTLTEPVQFCGEEFARHREPTAFRPALRVNQDVGKARAMDFDDKGAHVDLLIWRDSTGTDLQPGPGNFQELIAQDVTYLAAELADALGDGLLRDAKCGANLRLGVAVLDREPFRVAW